MPSTVGFRGTEDERFWRKVTRGTRDECWIWRACITKDGYGHFGLQSDGSGKVKLIKAHQWAYIKLIGPIPEGLEPDHLCRNRACCNPWHLELVTKRVNILRGEGPTAVNARKTECKRGHQLSGKNLMLHGDGRRECRQCSREHKLKSYHAKSGKGAWKWKKRKELNE